MRRSHPDSTIVPAKCKPENFCAHGSGLLLKGGWPTQNPLPAARGFGFRRFISPKDCRTRWSMSVSVVLYKNLGVSNTAMAFYTSWLYLPWVIKPLWSPVGGHPENAAAVDLGDAIAPRRGAGGRGADDSGAAFFPMDAGRFSGCWRSAPPRTTSRRTAFTCWRRPSASSRSSSASAALFYRVAMIAAQGGLVILAGKIAGTHRQFCRSPGRWCSRSSREFFCVSAFIIVSFCRGRRRTSPKACGVGKISWTEFLETFGTFFQKPKIVVLLLFLLLYRLGEAQLVKMAQFFLLDPRDQGGLALDGRPVRLDLRTRRRRSRSWSAGCSAGLWWRGTA